MIGVSGWLALLAMLAQDPRAAMEASIARQLASVEVQRAAIRARAPAPAAAACDAVPSRKLEPMLERTAGRQGLAPDLLRAVIEQESGYRPCAVSPKGALGLMQLMPATAALLGVEDPFDPAQNLNGGARFLRYLLGRYAGDTGLALAAYNAGPARVDAAGGIPPIPETLDYVGAILRRLNIAPPAPAAPAR